MFKKIFHYSRTNLSQQNNRFWQFRNYSLRTKLVIAFIVIAIGSVGSISFIVDRSLRTSRSDEIGNNMAVLAQAEAFQTGQILENDFNLLNSLALYKAVRDRADLGTQQDTLTQDQIKQLDQQWQAADAANNSADPLVAKVLNDDLSGEFKKFQSKFPEHVEIFLTDLQGVSIASSDRTSDYLQSDEAWWQTAYKEGQYIGQPEYDASTRTIAINMAVRVLAVGSNQIVGILRTTVNINSLSNALTAGRFGQTGSTAIYLPDRRSLSLIPIGDGKFELTVAKSILNISPNNQSSKNYLELPMDGIPSLLSVSDVAVPGDTSQYPIIKNLGWRVVVHQDQAEALKPVETQTRNDLLLAILVTILAAIAALGLSQVLAGPIIRLNSAAEKVAAGDLSVQAKVEANDETGTLAVTFNKMVSQLRTLIGSLEQRVADRTKALTTSAEVSRSLSRILDQKQLVAEVVEMVKNAFGYYHAHIYLIDEVSGDLVMAGGTGEAGKIMLANDHRIQKGKGLVGRAAETKQIVLVPDTSKDPTWLPNKLLPETKSELAVPILAGEQVLGVLDVQHNITDGLGSQDAEVIGAIANQMTVALQNIRLYLETVRFKLGIERSGDAVFATDPKGTIIYANPAFEKVYGYTPVEVIGKNPRIIKSGLMSMEKYQEFWGALLSKNNVTGEIVNKHKDGHLVYIAGTNSAIVDDSGDILGFLAVHHDVSETKKANEATKHTTELLSEALDIAKLANWEYDFEKDRFHFNDHFYSIFHTTAEQVGGYEISSAQYAQHLVHPDDIPVVGAAIEKALASKDQHYSTQLEHRILYSDGGIGFISVVIHIDRDDQGRIIRYYGANQDITESKLAYEAVQHTSELLSEALDIAKLANWEYDVEKDLFHFNDHFYSIFHTTADQVGGYEISSAQYAQHLVHPDDLPVVGAAIEQAVASKDQHYSTQLEHRIVYSDGAIGYISVVIHIDRDDQGRIIRYYGANQDITERKQAEEALKKRATELELAAHVSSAAATILETDQLLQEVVDLTKRTFNLYHAHIYLLDESGDTLQLTAGAGEVGKQMVAERRNIPLNREQSLVAQAARDRQGVIVNNVRNEPNFLPHPLLPETRAELAVPMIVGNQVVGVFDIQSDKVDHFTEDDIRIQTTLASQVAVAVQNARSFSQAQHQAKRETALNVINQKIQSATTVEAVLQIAARELGHALGAPLTIAQLGIKDRNNGGGQ